jgi:hypothetical protein
VRLSIDIFTDDPEAGAFRIHLTSRTRRLLVFVRVADTAELDELRGAVTAHLSAWAGHVKTEIVAADER